MVSKGNVQNPSSRARREPSLFPKKGYLRGHMGKKFFIPIFLFQIQSKEEILISFGIIFPAKLKR
jgi:hypothetical protein